MSSDVTLNPADRSLDCQLQGPLASTLSDEGFGYLWSGVRATHGITAGRFWFSVRVLEPLVTTAANIGDSADAYNEDETTANTIHCCRIGVSRLTVDVGSLGSHHSWGYGSAGKKSTGNIYTPYPLNQGRCFGPGDEVACFVDLSAGSSGIASISYAVNCQHLGTAFDLFQPPDPRNSASALFPHVLLKNVAVVVNLRGEQPRGWLQGQDWSGCWHGCLPWQASVASSIPATLGPSLRPFEQCTVVMMVGLPGAGKSYQAARLMSPQSARLQPQGSRTLVYQSPEQQQQQQQQEQKHQYLLLSLEAIVKQMKVVGLRRGGGAGVSAARTYELLGQAEEVFERLLDLAAQHPGNYIIDCPNVIYESRRRRLAAFRAAGFRLVAAVVVEEEAKLYKRLAQRDQQLIPAPEDMLEMQANFALPEVSPEEFDEVQFLGRISEPRAAADIVARHCTSAQQQLQRLQEAGWNYACLGGVLGTQQYSPNNNNPYNNLSSSSSSSSSAMGHAGGVYGPPPAAAADTTGLPPGSSWSRSLSQGLYTPDGMSRRASSTSSCGTISTALPPPGSYGLTGFSPWNPVHILYRPPSQPQTPALQPGWGGHMQQQQQQWGMVLPPCAGAAAATDSDVYGQQYSQYALPYDLAKQRMGSYGLPQAVAAPPSPQASSGLYQASSSLAGSRRASNGSSFSGAGSPYVRQPSWIGVQATVVAAGGAGGTANGGSNAGHPRLGAQQQQQRQLSAEPQKQQQQQQSPKLQTKQQPSRPTPGQWCRSSRCWGSAASAAGSAARAAAAAGQAAAPVAQADNEDFPTLYASVVQSSSKRQARSSKMKQQEEEQQQQQPTPHKAPLSPFAAHQALEGEEEQQQSAAAHSMACIKPSIGAAAAGQEAAAAVSGLMQQLQQQQQQPGDTSPADRQPRQRQQQPRDAFDALFDPLTHSFASASSTSSEVDAGTVELAPGLLEQLQQLQLASLSPEALVAAFTGQAPSRQRPRELGKGSFGIVYGCRMSDLLQGSSSNSGSSDGSSSSGVVATPATAAAARTNGAAAAAADMVAVKVLPPQQCTAAEFVRELQMLAYCQHQYLVALKGYCLAKRVLVFEYCSRGSLQDWLLGRHSVTRGAKLTWHQRLQVAHQVAGALLYLHSLPQPIIHRDIKPNNILITEERACCSSSCGCGCGCTASGQSCAEACAGAKPQLQASSNSASSGGGCSCGLQLSARLADVGLSRFLPVNLTSVQSSSRTTGCYLYLPDEYNTWDVVSCGLDAYCYGLTLTNMLTGDVFRNPRVLRWQLAEQLAVYEGKLSEAAAAEAAAAGAAATAAGPASPLAAAAATTVAAAGFPGAAAANGPGTGSLGGSSSNRGMAASKSHWWLGVMANCSGGVSRSSSSTGGTGSHTPCSLLTSRQASAASPLSPAAAAAAPPAAGAANAAAAASTGAGAGKSWASVAAARSAAPAKLCGAVTIGNTAAARGDTAAAVAAGPSRAAARSTASAGAAGARAVGAPGQLTAAAAVAAAAVPSADSELPAGFRDMLDRSAGEWPPRVAAGFAMLALACSEPERRKRPSMREVVAALEALQQQAGL